MIKIRFRRLFWIFRYSEFFIVINGRVPLLWFRCFIQTTITIVRLIFNRRSRSNLQLHIYLHLTVPRRLSSVFWLFTEYTSSFRKLITHNAFYAFKNWLRFPFYIPSPFAKDTIPLFRIQIPLSTDSESLPSNHIAHISAPPCQFLCISPFFILGASTQIPISNH